MKRLAQKNFDNQVKNLIHSTTRKAFRHCVVKLAELSDLLDRSGDEASADRVDSVIKEAWSIWDFLGGGIGGAATSKDENTGEWFGKSVLDAMKSGNWGKILDKKVLVKVITEALTTAVIASVAGEIIDALADKVPGFSLIKNMSFVRTAVVGSLTYAVAQSDFVTKLVDGLVLEIEKALGMGAKTESPKSNVAPSGT
jgi:hypothetical protein